MSQEGINYPNSFMSLIVNYIDLFSGMYIPFLEYIIYFR